MEGGIGRSRENARNRWKGGRREEVRRREEGRKMWKGGWENVKKDDTKGR